MMQWYSDWRVDVSDRVAVIIMAGDISKQWESLTDAERALFGNRNDFLESIVSALGRLTHHTSRRIEHDRRN